MLRYFMTMLGCLCCFFVGQSIAADEAEASSLALMVEQVAEDYPFYGLAGYYNSLNYYLVDSDKVRRLSGGESIRLKADQQVAVVGRFKVLIISGEMAELSFDGEGLLFANPELSSDAGISFKTVNKSALKTLSPVWDQLR